MIRPFLKWVGGKRQLLKEIRARLPEHYRYCTHVEPFIGGGSVLFDLQPERAYISDYNKYLMNAYFEVATDLDSVIETLKTMKNTKDLFYWYRAKYNKILSGEAPINGKLAEAAALFIYLNKTGFNGMYRLNKSGLYNVPWNKNPHEDIMHFINEDSMRETSKYLLDHVCIGEPKSYTEVFDRIKPNPVSSIRIPQFWYLDPPYAPLDKDIERGNFDQYTTFKGWDHDEQVKLRDFCVKLDKVGYCFMLSNSSCTLIKDLYKDFNIAEVDARRTISAKKETRGGCKEVIVTNY